MLATLSERGGRLSTSFCQSVKSLCDTKVNPSIPAAKLAFSPGALYSSQHSLFFFFPTRKTLTNMEAKINHGKDILRFWHFPFAGNTLKKSRAHVVSSGGNGFDDAKRVQQENLPASEALISWLFVLNPRFVSVRWIMVDLGQHCLIDLLGPCGGVGLSVTRLVEKSDEESCASDTRASSVLLTEWGWD